MNPDKGTQCPQIDKSTTVYIGPYQFSKEPIDSGRLKLLFNLYFGEFASTLYTSYCKQYGINNQEDSRDTTQNQR